MSEDTYQVGRADQVSVAGQLNQVIQSGLPLESALRALAEQTRSSQFRRALMELSENLERGMSLADALARNPNALPRRMKALITAGLSTGRLDTIMLYIVEVSQRAISIKQQIWLALSYPLFVIWVSLVICGSMVLGVIPQFQEIFDQFNLEIPTVTHVVIRFSRAMLIIGWQPWAILAVASLVAYLIFATIFISDSGYRWTTSIPLLGRVFRYAALTDFCRILAALAESGLPLNQSLLFAAEASDDRWIVGKSQLIVQEMDRGTSPSNAASIAGLPNTLCQVFRHTEAERTFCQALRGLADIFAAETQATSQFANGVIAQVAVAFVIASTGFCTIVMTIPLIKLLRDWL